MAAEVVKLALERFVGHFGMGNDLNAAETRTVMNNRTMPFIRQQAADVYQGGWPVLLRKIGILLMKVLTALCVLPPVLVMRVLRPFVIIRFGRLIVERIGHMALNTEFYLCDRELSMNGRRTIDLFWCSHSRPANIQLLKMWRRVLNVSPLIRPLWEYNRLLPGSSVHEIRDRFGGNWGYARSLLDQTQTHLRFTAEEEIFGSKRLREMEIPEDAKIVCFHARDRAYLEKEQPGRDWRYHDFRDASIGNFLPAAEEMTRRGYFAVRMGAIVKEPLSTDNSMIIDYSAKYRTDFLDVFLLAKCSFLIGTNTGVTDLADAFRKPVVKTNMTQFGAEIPLCGTKDLFIPKKFRLREEGRFITFRDLIRKGLWIVRRTEEYEQAGLEIVENSPEEILDVSIEMEERLKGTWQTTEEDEELQRRFWKILTETGLLAGPPVSRVGTKFLCQNRNLLE